jgi:hypothetical protein
MVGVQLRFAYRFTGEGPTLRPTEGFSLGASLQRRYLRIAEVVDLGAGLDLFYDRFAEGVLGSAPDASGAEQSFDGQRLLTETSFALLQTVSLNLGPVRPWLGLGGGLTIAYFSSPEQELRPGSTSAVQPLARAGIGADIPLRGRAAVGVRADYSYLFTQPTFTTQAGQTFRPFGNLFDVGIGLLYRF